MERAYLRSVAVLVALSTVVLTGAFVGVKAVLSGHATGMSGRLPYYVFGGAVVFVVSMVYLENPNESGVPIITSTVGLSVLGFVLIAFSGEGILYASQHPGAVIGSQLVVYFLAAALVCTGTAYWAIHHWREIVE